MQNEIKEQEEEIEKLNDKINKQNEIINEYKKIDKNEKNNNIEIETKKTDVNDNNDNNNNAKSNALRNCYIKINSTRTKSAKKTPNKMKYTIQKDYNSECQKNSK